MSHYDEEYNVKLESQFQDYEDSNEGEYIVAEGQPSGTGRILKHQREYDRAWNDFLSFSPECADRQPSEEDFIKYFSYLRNEKKLKSSTLWSTFSKINSFYQTKYTNKLQIDCPELTKFIRSSEQDYQRAASKTFQVSEIETFLGLDDLEGNYWMIRKAIAAVAFAGGLANSEVRDLQYEDLSLATEGFWIYVKRKERALKFLVPFNTYEPKYCLATHLSQYLDVLEEALSDLSGPLWRSTFGKKSSFVVQAMGKNSVNNVAKDVASVLGLLNQNEDESGGNCHYVFKNPYAIIMGVEEDYRPNRIRQLKETPLKSVKMVSPVDGRMRLKKVRTLEAPLSNPVRDANDEKKPRLRDPLLEDNDSSAVNPGTIGDDLASIDPYYPTCELETSEVSTYDDSENHGPKDKMSLEIELELALEVEDQIRASVIEYEETETSLNREISSLKAKLREKQFQLNSAKSSHDKEKSALEQSPNFRPGEVIATLTKKLHGIED